MYLLDYLNHIYIWLVPPQLSYGDTQQKYNRDFQKLTCVLTMLKNWENNGMG